MNIDNDTITLMVWLLVVGLPITIGVARNGLSSSLLLAIKLVLGLYIPLLMLLLMSIVLGEKGSRVVELASDEYPYWHLAMLAFIVYACICWYCIEIFNLQNRDRYWLITGMLLGTFFAGLNVVVGIYIALNLPRESGLATAASDVIGVAIILSIPLYTTVWFAIRSVQLWIKTQLNRPIIASIAAVCLTTWLALGFVFYHFDVDWLKYLD